MIKQLLKSTVRLAIGIASGDTVRILAGPLKGRRLLRQHRVPKLSMLFGTYESRFAKAFGRRVKDCSIVYDIGANSGYFSLFAAHQNPATSQIVAFEPVPEIINDLRAMVTANGLSSRIRACQLALSDSVGSVRMFTPGCATTSTIQTALRGQAVADEHSIDVEMSTLDQFVYGDGNPPPQVIKLDVEGAEALVLAGATRVLHEKGPTILAEIHGNQPAADVWDIVAPLDYRIHLLTESGECLIEDRETWMNHFVDSKWTIQHCVLTRAAVAATAAA